MDYTDRTDSPLAIVAKHQAEPPVTLGPIARDLGVQVKLLPLGKAISGQLRRDSDGTYTILINSEDPINRQRFTLAHELAHFILHRDMIDGGIIDDTMYRSGLSNKYEVQANQLAADMLMPIRLVKEWKDKFNDVSDLARKFNVSEQAMKIRLSGIEQK